MNKTHSVLKRLFHQKIKEKNKNMIYNKYSNSNLFELKEKNFLNKRQKTFTNINSHHKNKNENDLGNILSYLSTLSNFPKLDEKTISFYSEHNSPNKNYFLNYNEMESYSKKPKHKIKRNNTNNKTENFYLTQTNFSNKTNFQTISTFSNNNNNITNSNFYNKNESLRINTPKTIFKNIKFLTPREKSPENNNNIINIKMNKLNVNSRNNKNSTSFIKKTREKILMNYTLQIKRERKIRIKEKFSNQIENINDKINSLKMSEKLFNEQFLTKFYEYLKYLFFVKKIEKDKNIYLINKINILKKEITQLNLKIKKIENEKNLIYKWIYLIIKMKEKKIVLEDYYKIIIEEPNNSYILMMGNEKKDKNDSNLNNNKLLKLTSNRHLIKTFERRNSVTRQSRKLSRKSVSDLNNNSFNQNFLNLFKNMTKAEIENIRKYKNELSFNNVNEFFDCFKILQNDNLKLIEIYYEKRNSLDSIKKEKNEYENYIKKNIQYTNNMLKIKEIKFLNIKNKYNELLLYKEKLNNNQINNINDNNKNNSKNIINEKIMKLFEILNIFKLENIFDINVIKSKKLIGNTIPDIMFTIEFKINYLLNKMNYYKINNKEDYYKLKNEIENKHKIENAKRLKSIENNKFYKLKEKVEKRMNKIYYLPLKKVDNKINFKTFNKNKILKNDKDYENNNKFNFNNLMYDIYEKNL